MWSKATLRSLPRSLRASAPFLHPLTVDPVSIGWLFVGGAGDVALVGRTAGGHLSETRAARRGHLGCSGGNDGRGPADRLHRLRRSLLDGHEVLGWRCHPPGGDDGGRQRAHGGQLLGLFAGAHPLRRQGSRGLCGCAGPCVHHDKSSLKQLAHRYADETKRRLEEMSSRKCARASPSPLAACLTKLWAD